LRWIQRFVSDEYPKILTNNSFDTVFVDDGPPPPYHAGDRVDHSVSDKPKETDVPSPSVPTPGDDGMKQPVNPKQDRSVIPPDSTAISDSRTSEPPSSGSGQKTQPQDKPDLPAALRPDQAPDPKSARVQVRVKSKHYDFTASDDLVPADVKPQPPVEPSNTKPVDQPDFAPAPGHVQAPPPERAQEEISEREQPGPIVHSGSLSDVFGLCGFSVITAISESMVNNYFNKLWIQARQDHPTSTDDASLLAHWKDEERFDGTFGPLTIRLHVDSHSTQVLLLVHIETASVNPEIESEPSEYVY
jgi:hypothetical protein